MLKKKRMKLENLKVTSFLTSEEARNVRGMTELDTNCADTDCNTANPMNDCWDQESLGGTCGPTCNGTCYNSCNGTCTCGPVYTGDPTQDCDADC